VTISKTYEVEFKNLHPQQKQRLKDKRKSRETKAGPALQAIQLLGPKAVASLDQLIQEKGGLFGEKKLPPKNGKLEYSGQLGANILS